MRTTGTGMPLRVRTTTHAHTRARVKRLVRVVGQSMAPTYRASDLLLTRSVGRTHALVPRGGAAVFRHGEWRMIKRVVGMPGDLIELEAGRLFVNGETLDGRPRVRGALTEEWRVPGESYFMVGDNAEVSDDSRVWDEPFVRLADVEAVVTRRLWRRRRPKGVTRLPRATATQRAA